MIDLFGSGSHKPDPKLCIYTACWLDGRDRTEIKDFKKRYNIAAKIIQVVCLNGRVLFWKNHVPQRILSFASNCLLKDILVRKWIGLKTNSGSTMCPICECDEETV